MQTLFDASNTGGPDPSNPTGLTYTVTATSSQPVFSPAVPATGVIDPLDAVTGSLTIYDGGTPVPRAVQNSVGGFVDADGGSERLDVRMTPDAPGYYELEYPIAPNDGSGSSSSTGEIRIYDASGNLIAPDAPITPGALATFSIEGEAMSQTDGDIPITLYFVAQQTGGGYGQAVKKDTAADTAGDWVITRDGRAVSGSTTDVYLGQVVDLRVAPARPALPRTRCPRMCFSRGTRSPAVRSRTTTRNFTRQYPGDRPGQILNLGPTDYGQQEIRFVWPFAATSLDVSVGVAGDSWNTGSLTAPSRVVADATFNVDAPTGVTVTGSPNSQNALGGTAGFNCWGKAVDPTFPVSGVVMTAANPTIDPTQYNIFAGFGYLPTQSSGMTASAGVPGRQLMGGGGLHRRLVPGHRQAERNHSQGRTEFRECDRPGFPCARATAIPVRRLPVLPADQVQPGRAGRGRLSGGPIHALRPFRYVLYGQGGSGPRWLDLGSSPRLPLGNEYLIHIRCDEHEEDLAV